MNLKIRRFLVFLRHPLTIAVAGASVVALGMLFLGADLAKQNLLRSVETQQERHVVNFALSLHTSNFLPSNRSEIRTVLPDVATRASFDTMARRSLFGLDVIGLDLYSLEGTRLYTTEKSGVSPAVDTAAFAEARRGLIESRLQEDVELSSIDGGAVPRTVLTTYVILEDVAPGSGLNGRPMAVVAIHSDVSGSLAALRGVVWRIVGVYVGGLAVIIFLTSRFSQRARSRLEAANDELRVQYAAVRESRERMLATDEAVKRAIAEELHGSVQTKLYAVWMRLSALGLKKGKGDAELRVELDKISEEVDRIREEDIRLLSHRLHPGIIRMGALPGLRSLRDSHEHMISVELRVGDSVARLEGAGASRIPERIRLGVYRIADLALGNVVKHANASRCVVEWDLLPETNELFLGIEDDGVGFVSDPDRQTGLGLVTISDYADSMGGRFHIVSTPGKGTRVSVWIPASFDTNPLDIPLHSGPRSEKAPPKPAKRNGPVAGDSAA